MSKPASNATHPTTNETSDSSLKSEILITLKNACHDIHLPSFADFKTMVEHKDAVLCGNISFSSLYYDWLEFYNLENTIVATIAAFSDNAEDTAYLHVMLLEYKRVMRHFEQLKKSVPEPNSQSNSIMIDKAYYNDHLKAVYNSLHSFIDEFEKTYLTHIRETLVSLQDSRKQKDFPNTCSSRSIVTLMQFMKDYCEHQSNNLLESRKKSLQKAAQNNKIKLPAYARSWKRGQSKYYHLNGLLSNWDQYSEVLPNLPKFDKKK